MLSVRRFEWQDAFHSLRLQNPIGLEREGGGGKVNTDTHNTIILWKVTAHPAAWLHPEQPPEVTKWQHMNPGPQETQRPCSLISQKRTPSEEQDISFHDLNEETTQIMYFLGDFQTKRKNRTQLWKNSIVRGKSVSSGIGHYTISRKDLTTTMGQLQ